MPRIGGVRSHIDHPGNTLRLVDPLWEEGWLSDEDSYFLFYRIVSYETKTLRADAHSAQRRTGIFTRRLLLWDLKKGKFLRNRNGGGVLSAIS